MNKKLIELIKVSLELESDINFDTLISDIEEWDSLGHLSILTALSKASNGKTDDLDLTDLKTVNDLCKILDSNKIHI